MEIGREIFLSQPGLRQFAQNQVRNEVMSTCIQLTHVCGLFLVPVCYSLSLNCLLNFYVSVSPYRTFTITAIAQLCVLGIMWVFGCFQFDQGTLAMSYIFTILGSLQGVLMFILHCWLSKQVNTQLSYKNDDLTMDC